MNSVHSSGSLIALSILAGIVLAGAVLTITRRNLVSAVMALVATFFGIAGIYVVLSAPFLAAIQVLLYAGGIMVLFIFAVMVLNREETVTSQQRGWMSKVLIPGVVLFAAAKLGALLYTSIPRSQETVQGSLPVGTAAAMGRFLFRDYLFPFEAISLLLLIAVIAAVVIARSPTAHKTSEYEDPAGKIQDTLQQHTEARR